MEYTLTSHDPDAKFPTPALHIDKNGGHTLSIKSHAGTFHADVETRDDTMHTAIYLRFTPEGMDESIDIACIRDIDNSKDVQLLLWSDVSSEDPSEDITIFRDDIEQALLYDKDGTSK